MLRLVVRLSCIFIALVMFSGKKMLAQTGQASPLKIISWNIRLDTDHDGSNAWQFRRQGFCDYLKHQAADIVALQEVLHNQLIEIHASLPDYNFVGVGRADGISEGEYSPILFRSDKYEMLQNGNFWLSDEPEKPGSMGWDAACERIVSWVKLKEIGSGAVFYVFNTHFDHVGQQARLNSVDLILERIRSIADNLPVILAGDLNITPTNAAYQKLAMSELSDAREWAKSDVLYEAITYTGFDYDNRNDALIDFIFHSRHFSVLSYDVGSANAGGKFLSDHLPVIVEISLSK